MNVATASTAPLRRRSLGAILLEFLGSMNLAIALLVAVAIASVIGTVILQNQPYIDYVSRFGGFWFEVFRLLGLYDVYSAGWFLGILGFLVISTTVCVYRNGPSKLREMRHYRVNARYHSLNAFHHRREWQRDAARDTLAERAAQVLAADGFRLRRKEHGDHLVIAGMRGTANRAGYLFTHVAVVVICIGGLIDGNVGLKIKEQTGRVEALTDDMLISEIPPESRLAPSETISFRGTRTVPEGATVNSVTLNLRDGYVLQELPFAIEVTDFRIQYYPTGQPKSFESDLVIHDERLEAPLEQTIAVNHPLIYDGYAIYQSSFGDGGSKLVLRAWPLGAVGEPSEIAGAVFEHLTLNTPRGPLVLELDDFRLFNINPEEEEGSTKKFRNWGPSYSYKLRRPTGEAREYTTYMLPVEREGRRFFMSGVRSTPSEPFRYLRIPADPKGSVQRFMAFHHFLQDAGARRAVVENSARRTFAAVEDAEPALHGQLVRHLGQLLDDFARGGMDAVISRMQAQMSEQQLEQVGAAYLQALRGIAAAAYREVLRAEGVDVEAGVNDAADQQFFDDAFEALGVLPNYGAPVFLQLADFTHIEATGLQITRSPGKNLVYLGCVLLIGGIFVMFYIHHDRVWVYLDRQGDRARILFAASTNRRRLDFDRRFEHLAARLEDIL